MDPELIDKVTRLVVEKLQQQTNGQTREAETSRSIDVGVKFWNHTSVSNNEGIKASPPIENIKNEKEHSKVVFRKHTKTKMHQIDAKPPSHMKEKKMTESKKKMSGIGNPIDEEELKTLISKTPARIGIGRAGLRPRTDDWLKFRFDHAAAVDAVYGVVNDELLNDLAIFKVNTKVKDKEEYIRRPDYGRKLSDEAKKMIEQTCIKTPTVQIIVSDGLSSKAIEENLEDVYLSLKQSLKSLSLDMGTTFYIEKGRVAVMDEVGELLRPKVIVLLVGERPGLVSAESLSAYLCYEPRKGTIEANRMVISNIHKGGIPPVEAGAFLGTVVQKILKYEASGISLVQKEQ